MNTPVIVIGGGISGLSAAFFLRRNGSTVRLLETRNRIGGSIRTERHEGYLLELGPNTTAVGNVHLKNLLTELGLDPRVLFPGPHVRNRYVVRNGKLALLPTGPGSFLFGNYFSAGTKLGIFFEPFRKGGANPSESLASFIARRFGKEVAEYAVKPFVSGIYAGDANNLLTKYAFPSVYALEEQYGSVIGGAIKKMFGKKSGEPRVKGLSKSFSLAGGLNELVDALGAQLGDAVTTGVRDIALSTGSAGVGVSWTAPDGRRETVEHARVVISTPAYASSALVGPLDSTLGGALRSVVYPGVAIVHLGYDRAAIAHDLNGFGFLVPPAEKRNILGGIFSSSLFPGRAPEGKVLLTVFVGGAMRADMLARADAELVDMAHTELAALLGAQSRPEVTCVTRYEHAIPQYGAGYGAVIDAVMAFEARYPALRFCNNFRGGISVADCVKSAATLAATWGAE